jgi:hypothetical protein
MGDLRPSTGPVKESCLVALPLLGLILTILTFLHAAGRCLPEKRACMAMLDAHGRLWRPRRVLQDRSVQDRFLSHLPVVPEFMGLLPLGSGSMSVL